MRTFLLVLSLSLGFFAVTAAKGVDPDGAPDKIEKPHQKSEKPAPTVRNNKLHFSFPGLDGKPVSLSDPKFKDKVVIVTLWGTWCGACKQEIPSLKRLYAKYHDQGLELIALAYETPSPNALEILKQFVETNELKYTVAFAGERGKIQETLPDVSTINGTPTVFFIGRDGLVKKVDEGYWPGRTAKEHEEEVKTLLATPKSSD